MVNRNVVAPPAATSWGAVLGGWVATVGASVLFAPIVAGLLAAVGSPGAASDLAMAVPVVLGILVSYVVGGYVAGRMAGYRTSWHGMMTAFFSLFIVLLVLLAGGLADRGVFAGSGVRSLADIVPGMRDLNVDGLGNAVSFGAILGFLAAIFGGWLGGLLAPSMPVVATPAATRPAPVVREPLTREPMVRERHREIVRRGPLLPSFGRKGGERVEEREVKREVDAGVDEVHTPRVDQP
jgi:hypothetical protein